MNFSAWCTRIIRWAFYLLLFTVPLILTSVNFELFEFNKMMVTYAITVIIAGTWIVKMIVDRQVRIAKTPLDIPIGLFVLSQFVSTIFSMDPHVSWMGYYSRFNGGMWSVISYVILYYAFVSNFQIPSGFSDQKERITGSVLGGKGKRQKETITSESIIPNTEPIILFFKITIGTAIVVAAYGVAERMGIDKHLWVQDVQTRVFSTLGQPNWLAAYLVALIPVTMTFALPHEPTIKKGSLKSDPKSLAQYIFWTATTILFFVVLLFTRSRSGLLGLAVADVLFWGLAFLSFSRKRESVFVLTKPKPIPDQAHLADASAKRVGNDKKIITFLFLHIFFCFIVFINGSNIPQLDRYVSLDGIRNAMATQKPDKSAAPAPSGYVAPALESGGTESGTIRKYVWEAAISAWKSTTKTFLIGTGTETFAFAFYEFRPVGHNMTSEWDFLYNKAHNEYLNYLATTGILGLGTYMLILLVFTIWCAKMQIIKLRSETNPESSQLLDYLPIALFTGWLSILITNFFGFSVVIVQIFLFLFPAAVLIVGNEKQKNVSINLPDKTPVIALSTAVITASAIILGVIFTRWYADTLYASSYRLARSGQYAQADQLIERAITLNPGEPIYHDELSSTLAALAAGALEQQNATAGSELAQRAINEDTIAISISPLNVTFWKTKTKIFYTLSVYDPKLNAAAIAALEKALSLSPNDPKMYYNLAILYGRQGENDRALQLLSHAVSLKPDYKDAYYALYVFYQELKQPDQAQAILEKYLTNIDPNDSQFKQLLAKPK